MPQAKTLTEAFSSTPSALMELWTLDGTAIGMTELYRFVNGANCNYQPITFNGVQYTPFPILIENVDSDGKGSLPRPKLTVSNINGFVSNLLLQYTNLEGATVTRTRVHARYLDRVNWPADRPAPSWVTPDPTAAYSPESWQVNRKMTENPSVVTWELKSPLEAQRARLPIRQMVANTCVSWKYRQPGTCDYSGVPVADRANRTFTGPFYSMTLSDQGTYSASATYNRGDYVKVFSTLPQFADIPFLWVCTTNGTTGVTPATTSSRWVADACAKSSAACKLRFVNTPLRISSFAGIARAPWVRRA